MGRLLSKTKNGYLQINRKIGNTRQALLGNKTAGRVDSSRLLSRKELLKAAVSTLPLLFLHLLVGQQKRHRRVMLQNKALCVLYIEILKFKGISLSTVSSYHAG